MTPTLPIVSVLFAFLTGMSWASDPYGLTAKPTPQALFRPAQVVVDWSEPLDDCASTQICVQGELHNSGHQTAYDVKLRIDVGATSLGKPRATAYRPVELTTMNPGDRQDFYFKLDRKIKYNQAGKIRFIEVGRFNFKVVPTWSATAPKPSKKHAPTKTKRAVSTP